MIAIPPYVLLLPYGVFMLGFLFFALANIVSLARYGARNAVGLTATFTFVCGTLIVLFMTWQSLGGTVWSEPVPIIGAAQIGF